MAFFGNLRRRKNTTRKAVYSDAIDFDRSKAERMRLGDLSPSGRYRLQNNESTNEQQITTYDEIKRFVVDVVNNELKSKCQGYLDIPIESITVRDTHEGSIVVLFTVLLNVFQFLGSIKDFHDSIELIKDIANEHIKIRLAQRYGDYFEVSTRRRIPSDRHFDYYEDMMMHKIRKHPALFLQDQGSKRDGFFYYLLV